VLPIGEYLVLHWQKSAAGIHQVKAGQTVLLGYGLGPGLLFDRERIISAALHRGIVNEHHALATADPTDTCDQAGAGNVVVVDLVGGQLGKLEERCAGIEQGIEALPRQEFAPGQVPFPALAPPPSLRRATSVRSSSTCACMASRLVSAFGVLALKRVSRIVMAKPQAEARNSSRPISIRRISEVPAPIS
jgi:hypothetical protein